MTKSADHAISATNRVYIIGPTGSGKTTLLAKLVGYLPANWPVVGIDPKPARDMKKLFSRSLKSPEDIAIMKGRARVHRPTFERGAYDEYLRAVWARQNCTVVIDDLRLLMLHGTTNDLETLLVAGRERGIGVCSCMQRPIDLLELITEAEWIFAFRLQMRKDRDRIAERGFDADAAFSQLKSDHDFLIHRRGWDKPIIMNT